MKLIQLIVLASSLLPVCLGQTPVNPHAALIQDFQKRVDEYMKLRKAAEAKLPALKTTPTQGKIADQQRNLASEIQEARADAKQGDIFTPEISDEFRRLIGIAMQGSHAARIKDSLKSAEPLHLRLAVNAAYPDKVPLQSTPPTLLLNLPKLPPDLDYRLVGRDLALRDAKANLVVDIVTGAIP
jgi:hypothetical protein